MVKNLTASVGDTRAPDPIPSLGRSPGGGNGKPLQDACPENPKDRGAWKAIHGAVKGWTQLSTHTRANIKLASIKTQKYRIIDINKMSSIFSFYQTNL